MYNERVARLATIERQKELEAERKAIERLIRQIERINKSGSYIYPRRVPWVHADKGYGGH